MVSNIFFDSFHPFTVHPKLKFRDRAIIESVSFLKIKWKKKDCVSMKISSLLLSRKPPVTCAITLTMTKKHSRANANQNGIIDEILFLFLIQYSFIFQLLFI